METFLTALGASLAWFPLYALPAAIGVVPALLLLRRRDGRAYAADWATLYVPVLVWVLAIQLPGVHKSLGNVVELPIAGLAVALLAAARWFAGGRGRDRAAAWMFLTLGCTAAIVVAHVVPWLPE